MKKVLATMIAVGCFAAAGTALAGMPAATGVNGSLHDMNVVVGPNADSMGRVCVFCHTPHNAQSNDGAINLAPLWNRTDTALIFKPYVWATPANTGPTGVEFEILDPLAGPSRLCMTCHDGSIAVDQHGPAMAQTGGTKLAAANPRNLGNDLTKTHPIGFSYTQIRDHRNSIAGIGEGVDTEIVDPEKGFATAIDTSGTDQGVYNVVTRNGAVGNKRIKDVLYGGTIMTCASCHEVHNKENAIQDNYRAGVGVLTPPTGTAPNYFLYAKQQDSLICLSCHIK